MENSDEERNKLKNPDEIYEKLVVHYQRWYSNPLPMLNKKIRKLIERGLSWGEAVQQIYMEELGEVFGLEVKPKISISEALSVASNRLKFSPTLAIPVLVGNAVGALYSASYLLLLIVAGWLLAACGVNAEKAVELLVDPWSTSFPETAVIIARAFDVSIVSLFLLVEAASTAWRAGLFYQMFGQALEGVKPSLAEAMEQASRRMGSIFPVAFIVVILTRGMQVIVPRVVNLWLSASLLTLFLWLVFSVLTKFTLASCIISRNNPLRALRESISTALAYPGKTLALVIFTALLWLIASLITLILTYLGVATFSLVALLLLLYVQPILDGCTAILYLHWTGKLEKAEHIEEKVSLERIVGLGRRSLQALREAAKDLRSVSEAAAILGIGVAVGLLVSRAPPGEALYKFLYENPCGCAPPTQFTSFFLALNIFFNNWNVAAISAVSGSVTLLLPASIALVNGLIIGLVAGFKEPIKLLMFIAPHGVIELPSFIVAIAAGIKYYKKASTPAAKAEGVKQALLVAIGLAPLFLLAAFIEAYISIANFYEIFK